MPLDPTTAQGGEPDSFLTHRRLLFTIAYEILGSAADAEDVLQESWLRWSQVAQDEIHAPRAYLVRIVTRQSLNHLRTQARRREEYIGEWLPEPLLTTPDVAEDVEFAESLSVAMLTVLQTLTPAERAVFVLKEVFDVPYGEIAEAVDKTPAAVRQLAHRAKSHVAARRPRVSVARSEHVAVVNRLVAALNTGDMQGLMDVLAPDVVSIADGGGKARGAARRPVVGALRLARYLIGGLSKAPVRPIAVATIVNGQPAIRMEAEGQLLGVAAITVVDGKIARVLSIANPDKLGHLDEPADVGR